MQHPLYPKMKLLAIQLSGRHSETQVFLQKLLTLSQICGEQQRKVVMNQYSDNGSHMLHQGIRIPILQMFEHSVGISYTYVPKWVFA